MLIDCAHSTPLFGEKLWHDVTRKCYLSRPPDRSNPSNRSKHLQFARWTVGDKLYCQVLARKAQFALIDSSFYDIKTNSNHSTRCVLGGSLTLVPCKSSWLCILFTKIYIKEITPVMYTQHTEKGTILLWIWALSFRKPLILLDEEEDGIKIWSSR